MKIKIYKLIRIVAGLVIIAIYSGCDPVIDLTPDNEDVCLFGGDQETWDSDGDGISDATENNNSQKINDTIPHPELSDTICNVDSSKAVGDYCFGSLKGGYNLKNSNTGYTTYQGCDPIDTDDWGTLDLINCIEVAGREFGDGEPLLRKGDMSLKRGGLWGCDATGGGATCCGHSCHENGLEVDIRYLRKNNYSSSLDISVQSQKVNYDTTLTKVLMKHIILNCNISCIFVDITNLGFSNDDLPGNHLVDKPKHSDHFHVRLVNTY